MKKLLAAALLFTCIGSRAQNMVPNGDFENYNLCPTGFSQTSNCTGWRMPTGGSSDYFNACAVITTCDVPNNIFGTQTAASGNAYMGGYTYVSSLTNYKEYVATNITPLTIGVVYEVSLSVSLADNSGLGTNDIGVFFYDNGPALLNSSTAVLSVTPQVSYSSYGVITNQTGWTRLVGTFTADSAYDNIVIGGFSPYSSMTTSSAGGSGSNAYYYFDSIVVKVASHIVINYNDSLLCAGDTIQVPFTTSPSNYFNTTNVFTLQLSNSSGSFASPVNIGTLTGNSAGTITGVIPSNTLSGAGYKIRIIASSPGDSAVYYRNIGIGNPRPAKPVANNNGPICSGSTLNLTASTTTSGVSWKWTGPNSFSSTLQNPSITNAQGINSGSYIVTAYIYGCQSKDTTIAGVASTTGSALASSNSPVCDNDTLKLMCNGTGPVLSYSWAGPNSFSSSVQNPTIVHPTSAATGNYYLSVALPGCTILDTIAVQVKPTPVGLTKSSNSPVCIGDTIRLFASSTTTGVNYLWSGPNSFATFTQNPVITNAAAVNAGKYTINYLLNGCSVSDSVNVVVNPKPAPVTATVNTPICAGSTLNLTASTATGGVTYSWVGPNSFSSSAQNPSVTNAQTSASGDYIVTATLGSCSVKDTATALVKPLPANISAANNTPVCQGGTLALTASTSSSGVSYSWTGPNSFSSTQQNPSVANAQPVASGVYTVTFNLNGCSAVSNTTATVTANPAKPAAGSNTPVCTGTPINLTASAVPGASSYSWNGPAGFSSLLQNPVIGSATATMGGTYIVRAYNNGCYSAPDSTTVTIIPAPVINIYPNPNDTICQNTNVTFVAVTSNAGSSTSFRWFRNNSFTGNTGASFSSTGIADNDIIFCELTAAGVCPSVYKDSSNTIQMTVLPWLAPAVSITSNPATPLSPYQLVTFTANASNAGSSPGYQWKRNGNDVVGATSSTWGTHQLSDNDDISVVVTSSYMCPQPPKVTSNIIKVSVLTGVDDVNGANTITLYPNPNNGMFTVKGSLNNKDADMAIINAVGQTVYNKNITTKNGEINEEADVRNLAAGMYLLRIKTGESIQNIRFIIERK